MNSYFGPAKNVSHHRVRMSQLQFLAHSTPKAPKGQWVFSKASLRGIDSDSNGFLQETILEPAFVVQSASKNAGLKRDKYFLLQDSSGKKRCARR